MTNLELIVFALNSGTAGFDENRAEEEIIDAYARLRGLVLDHLSGNLNGEMLFMRFEENPDLYDGPLMDALDEVHADKDPQIIEAAQTLLQAMDIDPYTFGPE